MKLLKGRQGAFTIEDLSNVRLQPSASAAERGKVLYLNFSKDRPEGAATD
ncbi:hypothetical protein OG921_04655 [Aldersonia sp. NBC_00410]|nr:hypothetical protein [Aldersonia sp. NBC_00410]MCX5042463.1 hypothetical protein [Aldersonia sp. NBC_00410]